ncbi:S9 family peptidase [Bacteroidota bacterium]
MKRIIFVSCYALVPALLLIMGPGCQRSPKTPSMEAPIAEKIEKELTMHGHTRIDPYYWLNDRENPKVIDYLNAENAYKDAMLKDTEELQEKLFNEIVGRIKKDDSSVPYFFNGYFYYARYEEGKEYAFYCRKKGNLEAEEEILLDMTAMAEGYDYFAVGGTAVSPNNKLMAYGVDTVGRRKYTLFVKNLETGELYKESIPTTGGYAAWANDNKTIFYSRKDEVTLRSDRIFKHFLGTPEEKDELVYFEEDETFNTFVYRTKSDKYLIIGSSSIMSNEYRFVDAGNPNGKFKILQERERGLEYSVGHFKDHFYIVTNLDAQNFRCVKTPVTATSKENWVEVIGHREDVYLDDVELFGDYLVVAERKEGLMNLRVISWETGKEHYLDYGEEVYVSKISTNPEFDTKILRFTYSSPTTPNSTYDYNMETREKKLMKQEEVLGGFESANYEAKRLYAKANDGTMIPMSVVYRKGMTRNGKNPCLIIGYGSYGITREPDFSSSHLSLLDRGFIIAIAHVRGGQIMGRKWYEDGKLLKKKNTFTDFNNCAEFLIAEKYTSPDHLFAMGGSAGGLLMGAIANLQPELYKGIISAVPFVDVVTTMLDESIPLTTGEFDEWGNPKEKQYYDYMLSYSPYDNVEAKDYPNMLVTTGLHDSQVQYWEPAKWVAKLRDTKTDDNLLVMHTNMDAGHGGKSGRFRQFKETALEYAFMLKLEGIEE